MIPPRARVRAGTAAFQKFELWGDRHRIDRTVPLRDGNRPRKPTCKIEIENFTAENGSILGAIASKSVGSAPLGDIDARNKGLPS